MKGDPRNPVSRRLIEVQRKNDEAAAPPEDQVCSRPVLECSEAGILFRWLYQHFSHSGSPVKRHRAVVPIMKTVLNILSFFFILFYMKGPPDPC